MISRKKHLEIAIESIPPINNPQIKLEQYSTPSVIAADLIWNAYNIGDIANKSIIDLGCGTGILTFSSLFLNPKIAIGVDIDSNSVAIAKNTAKKMKIDNSHFIVKDVRDIHSIKDDILLNNDLLDNLGSKFDTLFTNPPFGSQSQSVKGKDRIFMELAIKLANVSYSFHMAKTKDFLMGFYEKLGGTVTHEFSYKFPLKNSYSFHTKELRFIDVIVLRVENNE